MELIIPGLSRIPLVRDRVNTFLLQGEDGFTLVDCGHRRRELATDFAETTASVRKVAHLRPRTTCSGHLKPLMRMDPQSLIGLADRLEHRCRSVAKP